MSHHPTTVITGLACCLGLLVATSNSYAQSRTPPAGSGLAQTPPIDQKPKQYDALPKDQKNTYDSQVPAGTAPPKN